MELNLKYNLNESVMINNTKIDTGISYTSIIKTMFCLGIGSKKFMAREVDKIFDTNKILYMEAYKRSDLYKNKLMETVDINTALYAEKVAGILQCSIESKNYTQVLELYKKAYKKIYSNIKNLKVITEKDFAKYINPGVDGNYEYISTVYIYSLLNKFDLTEMQVEYFKRILKDMAILAIYQDTNYSKEVVDKYIGRINELRDYLGIQKGSYNGEELVEIILRNDTARYNKSKILTPWEMIPDNDTSFKIEKIGEVGRYIGAMEGFFKYLRINTSELLKNTTFTGTEINQWLLSFILGEIFNNFKDSDKSMFLINTLYTLALNKSYKNLRASYLKAVNEDYLLEIDKLQTKLTNSINKVTAEKESLEKKEDALKKREKELLEEIERLKLENSRLKTEAKEGESLKQEVVKLRNYVFDLNNLNTDEAELEHEVNIDLLNNKNIVILGGTLNWEQKMKEVLPNATFVGNEQMNTSINFINKKSIVFINTKMKHAFYYKIKSVLDKVNPEYYYINNETNIKYTLELMESLLNSK